MKTLLLSILLISISACASDNDGSTDSKPNMQRGEGGEDSSGITSKMYSIRFISLWNATDHVRTPGNAHFSPIVTTVHNTDYALFPKGQLATRGFQSVAEFGQTANINREISVAVSSGSVGSTLNTENQFIIRDGILEQTFIITATKTHPLFSFITMIAPSPDWIVGVSGVELYNQDGFISEAIEMDLHAYHAGTQNGDVGGNFSLGREATNPQQPISRLSGNGLNAAFARVVITPIN